MRQNPFKLFAICILLFATVHAKDEAASQSAEVSSKPHQQEQISTEGPQDVTMKPERPHQTNRYSVKGHPEIHASKDKQPDTQLNDQQSTEVHHDDKHHSGSQQVQHSEPEQVQHSEPQQVQHSEPQQVQHSEPQMPQSQESHPEVHFTEVKNSKPQVPTGRQFLPPPYHQHMLFQPPTGFEAIRRQLGGGFGSDLVMMGLISLPILGLLTMGSASLGNLFGLGASSSSSKKSSSKRNKRSLKEKAADAVEYAKNLWNVMEQLERAFEKYDLYQAECRLRVVCEAHHKDRRMGSWGQNILDLMRQQKELEGRELLPVSRFLFSNYAEAAQAGARNENCAQLYTGCPRHLSYYLSSKEDQLENEVENGM